MYSVTRVLLVLVIFPKVRHFSEVPSIAPVLIFLAAQTIERRWGESDQNWPPLAKLATSLPTAGPAIGRAACRLMPLAPHKMTATAQASGV